METHEEMVYDCMRIGWISHCVLYFTINWIGYSEHRHISATVRERVGELVAH